MSVLDVVDVMGVGLTGVILLFIGIAIAVDIFVDQN
jgi:hypothetical protein